jgi:hypothetical protein
LSFPFANVAKVRSEDVTAPEAQHFAERCGGIKWVIKVQRERAAGRDGGVLHRMLNKEC